MSNWLSFGHWELGFGHLGKYFMRLYLEPTSNLFFGNNLV